MSELGFIGFKDGHDSGSRDVAWVALNPGSLLGGFSCTSWIDPLESVENGGTH